MNTDLLMLFDKMPGAFPLYKELEKLILEKYAGLSKLRPLK